MGRHIYIYKIRVLKADRIRPTAECIEKLKKGQFIYAGVGKNPFKEGNGPKVCITIEMLVVKFLARRKRSRKEGI